jgi:hypothetical protein
MHRIDDAIVREGKIMLANLPFAEGQHVNITVTETGPIKRSIEEIRAIVRGSYDVIADPGEPLIPLEDWEGLK